MTEFDDKAAFQNKATAEYGLAPIDHEQIMRDQRVQSAIYHLTEARRVRADLVLMAEIRAWLREKRSEFMLLLDDLGD